MNIEKLKKDYGEVLWAGRKCILGLPISFTRYIITTENLYTKIGFLNIKEDEIALYRIYDKQISFSFWQRIVRCGTITLMSKDSDTQVKKLVSVRNPRNVKKILDEVVSIERERRRVPGRDMIGGLCNHDHSDDSDFDEINEDF